VNDSHREIIGPAPAFVLRFPESWKDSNFSTKENAMARPASVACLLLTLTIAANGAEPKRPANRLASETSPYLRLHAHNPVDWYPWGPEAFTKAKAEKKPIFLSIGYSSCYWCHVMERECFEDPEIARLLNERFVSIKVDREERPDVDQVYMTALQAFSQGGWPLSMFLTPDGRPFFGGTYFPPKDRDGVSGFPTVLKGVSDAWRDERPKVEEAADQLVAIVRRALDGSNAKGGRVPLTRAVVAEGRAHLAEQFDAEHGGFGFNPRNPRRPKFPEPVNLVFLLDQHRRNRNEKKEPTPGANAKADPLTMVVATMDHMARGGIRDHLAGGYHRYSTDRFWTVPHFEKMLYDNAQLASAHLLAFETTNDPRWRREAEDTFAFIGRTMTAPEGGFYSALDAETNGEEGQSYVWTREEVKSILGTGYEPFARVYGVTAEPNFEKGRYVLFEPLPRAEQAEALKTTPEALEASLAPLRTRMLDARNRRPTPLLDDKILTSWNGLMIAAYAEGYRLLKDPRYRAAAEKAADFLLAKLRTPQGRLLRTYREGQAKLPAYLEDYAFLAHGLLRLHAATGDPNRLAQARALTDRMLADFADEKEGGFFYTADDHETLLARAKDPMDNVLPSGNSVAIRNLVALAAATGEARYLDEAGKALDAFSPLLVQSPGSFPLMLVALSEYLDARPQAGAALIAAAPGNPPVPAEVVTAQAELAKGADVAPGRAFDVVVTLTIQESWHTYANPTGTENLRPTVLALAPDQPAALVQVTYPPGKAKLLASSGDERVLVYEDKVTLTARVRLDPAAKSVPASLKFQVKYQACDARACLAPATRDVSVSLAR
jgi:uncharacterized protein YyaL (SSP411 family)